MKQYKAVIFDLDGTLIDSMWVWQEIDKTYLGKFGLEPPKDIDDLLEGKSFTETAIYFKDRFQITDSIEKIKAEWNEIANVYYLEQVPLKPNAEDFLCYLKQKGIALAIGTSNSIELVTAVLEKQKIAGYFDAICTGCEVEKGKPDPAIYLEVARKLNVSPESCLVIEDIPNGVLAAKRAGMDVWAITDRQQDNIKVKLKKQANAYIENYLQALEKMSEIIL